MEEDLVMMLYYSLAVLQKLWPLVYDKGTSPVLGFEEETSPNTLTYIFKIISSDFF